MTEEEVVICKCGQWNRLASRANKRARFTCGTCGKALLSIVSDNSGDTIKGERLPSPGASGQKPPKKPARITGWLIGGFVVLGIVGIFSAQYFHQNPTARAIVTAPQPRALTTRPISSPASAVQPRAPLPTVRDCQSDDFFCILDRNKEIMILNTELMKRGTGPLMLLTALPPPPPPLPLREVRVATPSMQAARNSPPPAPSPAPPVTTLQPVPAPPTSVLDKGGSRYAIAPLTIETESGTNYLIKFVNVANERDHIMIFVKGGEAYSTKMPLGTYLLRAATGDTWYGRKDLFGPETQFFRLRSKEGTPQIFTFSRAGNTIHGMRLSFKRTVDGNMEQEKIGKNQF